MEEKILEAREEFNKLIDFVTKDALTWELHSVEGEGVQRVSISG